MNKETVKIGKHYLPKSIILAYLEKMMSVIPYFHESIYNEIIAERKRQYEKWGVQDHCPADWCMILGEEVGEVNKAALQARFSGAYMNSDNEEYEREQLMELRKELIQVAAVAVAFLESLDRNELKVNI